MFLMIVRVWCVVFSGTFCVTVHYWSQGKTQNEMVRSDQRNTVLYLRPQKFNVNPFDRHQCWGNICSIVRPEVLYSKAS